MEVYTSESPDPFARRIAVVGDSHPTQFLAALRPVAVQRGWRLIVMSRGGCPFSAESEIRPDDQTYRDWNNAVLEELSEQRLDSCPPVIGNMLVYMDDNHVGATYLSTMAPMVEKAIVRAVEHYPERTSPS